MAIRSQSVVEDALLDLLAQHDEPIRSSATYAPLADLFELTLAERQQQLTSRAGRAWDNTVQWARAALVSRGHLDNSARGFWSLTQAGRQLAGKRGSEAKAAASPDFMMDGAEAFIDAVEGRQALRTHLIRERSKTLVEAFKGSLTSLSCQACGFDFDSVYGAVGQGYIEAHHTVPVSSLKGGARTRLEDLAALCANCHRVIHRNGLISVDALKAILRR